MNDAPTALAPPGQRLYARVMMDALRNLLTSFIFALLLSPATLTNEAQDNQSYGHAMINLLRNSLFILTVFLMPCAAMAADTRSELETGLAALKSKDFPEAIRNLLPLAVEGNAEAQFQIGLMYYKGDGLPKDRCVAVSWLEKAARQAHARAAMFMAFYFSLGGPVKRDDELAYRWASLAHKLGHAQGESQMFVFGHDLPQDKKDAIDQDMKAWDPAQLPQTEYFFIDESALQPLDYYQEFIKRTGLGPCR